MNDVSLALGLCLVGLFLGPSFLFLFALVFAVLAGER